MRSNGLIARNNQQSVADVPRTWADAVRPTQTFQDKTTLKIGGEDFVLTHARGETEDQIWVAVPGRGIVASADYFQGFCPMRAMANAVSATRGGLRPCATWPRSSPGCCCPLMAQP